MDYIRAFLAGGVICALVQILMEKTKMNARPYYGPFSSIRCDFGCHRYLRALQRRAGAGASVPLLGFGNTLWQGVKKAVGEDGILGAFKGGLTAPPAVLPQPLCLVPGIAGI